MLNFMKVPPTTYVLQFKRGKVKREGVGLSFIYSVPTSTIVTIPIASADVPFAFQESTADFQSVTLQGQLTYPRRRPEAAGHSAGFQRQHTPRLQLRRSPQTAGATGAHHANADARGHAENAAARRAG